MQATSRCRGSCKSPSHAVAFGFLQFKFKFLSNAGWNVLDFIVVMFGFLELVPSVGNYTVIRCARVLRPLRAITKIEALRVSQRK